MKASSYILAAVTCLSLYTCKTPFSAWLKQYFREHKKFGSRDRKIISHLCYSYFRLGGAFEWLPVEERITRGLFLTSSVHNPQLAEVRPEWNTDCQLSIDEKFAALEAKQEWALVFPMHLHLSPAINKERFIKAHLVQPQLHLRIRPGRKADVLQKLNEAQIAHEQPRDTTLSLANTTKIDELLELDAEAVVQDISSQEVLQPLQFIFATADAAFTAWDCCAASGGKSILLFDTYPNVHLTVSDVRSGILTNLHQRFRKAGITNYDSFVADVGGPQFTMSKTFDLVICDVPCTGSGTWSRTPEQLSCFTEERIKQYADRQKWIGTNAAKSLKKGGALLYITCSVFKEENEDGVKHLQQAGLQLRSSHYFEGYTRRGDTLFAALLTL